MKRKQPKWNWFTFLSKAIKKEPGKRLCKLAAKISKKWPTCATKQFCKGLPKYPGGQPKDEILVYWGLWFHHYVYNRRWLEAFGVLQKIEARAAELLRLQP